MKLLRPFACGFDRNLGQTWADLAQPLQQLQSTTEVPAPIREALQQHPGLFSGPSSSSGTAPLTQQAHCCLFKSLGASSSQRGHQIKLMADEPAPRRNEVLQLLQQRAQSSDGEKRLIDRELLRHIVERSSSYAALQRRDTVEYQQLRTIFAAYFQLTDVQTRQSIESFNRAFYALYSLRGYEHVEPDFFPLYLKGINQFLSQFDEQHRVVKFWGDEEANPLISPDEHAHLIDKLSNCPSWYLVTGLDLSSIRDSPTSFMNKLLACPGIKRMRALTLNANNFSADDIKLLAHNVARLPRLKHLDLSMNLQMEDQGLLHLIDVGLISQLTYLNITYCSITDRGIDALGGYEEITAQLETFVISSPDGQGLTQGALDVFINWWLPVGCLVFIGDEMI